MLKNFYVTTKTPLRVSFLGGGTDQKIFYSKFSGKVISTSINKYIYVTIKSQNNFFNENYRINYSKTERVKNINQIQNKIIKACLKYTNNKRKLYISTVADIPDSTGLGSSSAFTVGLLKALYFIQNKKKTNKQLAEIASKIEIDVLKSPIGKQDQYACALGGYNIISFNKNGSVKVKTIKNKKIINNLINKCSLIWTGKFKKSSKILSDQKKRIQLNYDNLKKMLEFTKKLEKNIESNSFKIKNFRYFLNHSWLLKKNLSNKISNRKIDNIINKFNFKKHSFKLLGAGGGGFIYVSGKNHEKIIKKHNFVSLKIKPESNGSQIIYYEK